MASRELVSPEGLRLDGRRAREVRRVACRLGVFPAADGSAFVEMGNTRVVATVYGPREAAPRQMQSDRERASVSVDYAVAPFSTSERRRVGRGDRRSAEAALVLRQTFERCVLTALYPRSHIAVHVQVLQADGGELAAAVNATTLALIGAGIPMRSFATACSGGFADGTAVLDVNYVERSSGCAEMVLVCDPADDLVYATQMVSKMPLAHFEEVAVLAREGCRQVHAVLRRSVMEHSMRVAAHQAAA